MAQAGVDGAALDERAFALRWTGADAPDRLLLVNLGAELRLDVLPEPLLAPPGAATWAIVWSSEDPRYGGGGTAPLETDGAGWLVSAEAAVLLVARPCDPA